ncbi:tyrosine-type recombinase/integrase [Verrucomicrobiota bacterium sgz303538]
MVDTRIAGKGERLYFKTKIEADIKAEQLRTKRQNEGTSGVQIPDRLRVEALECDQRLKAVGATLREATEFFLKHVKPVSGTRTCHQAAEELLEAKRKAGKRESYLKGLGWALGAFNRSFGETKTSEITQDDIEEWLDEQEFKLATRRAYIRDLGILFNFSVDRGYSAANAVARIEKPVLEDEPPEIFTVLEAETLLRVAAFMSELSLVPVLAIGLFAGLRTSELRALDWSEVDLEERIIEVKGKKAKTRQRRLVKISDNLLAWLKPHSMTSGSVVNGRFRERLGNAVAQARTRLRDSGDQKSLGKWPKNGMRHSFASYHLALHQNAALTALELGHADTTMLFAHYRNLVKPKEAARYWEIMPEEK